ncbi:MAG: hypothetical protein WD883_00160 [Candidatus Colwellbacteria bacterium]
MNKKVLIVGIVTALTLIALAIFWAFFYHPDVRELERILELQENNQLSEEGMRIKEEIIATLRGSGGALVQTPEFEIGYLTPPLGQFNIIIFSEDEDAAEATAIAWLRSRGLSESDICNIPTTVSFANEKSSGKPDRLPTICR